MRLGADRLLLQRRLLPLEAVAQLQTAASRLGELRAQPRADAAVVARLPLQMVYYLKERRGDWLLVGTAGSGSTPAASGWVPRSGHCSGACAPLTAGPRFVSELLAFIEKRRPPGNHRNAGPRRAAAARPDLRHGRARPGTGGVGRPRGDLDTGALAAVTRRCRSQRPRRGAGSANLRLLARLTGELRRARLRLDPRDPKAYDRLQLPPEMVRAATYEAAEATVVDPSNVDLLHNLRVLYAALGDRERATLAANLLERAGSSSRQRLLPSR